MSTINVAVSDPDAKVVIQRPTPQHDRLREVKDISQKLHEFFLEFLPEKKLELGKWNGEDFWPSNTSIQELIADFLEIDLAELENEKRRMLIDIRTDNARRDAEKELPLAHRT